MVYLDDGIGAAKGVECAQKASEMVQETLHVARAGFVVHPEKSSWQPSSIAKWLGFSLEKGCVFVPPEKVSKLEDRLRAVVEAKSICAKELASITRTLISMSPGIGQLVVCDDTSNVRFDQE